MSKIIELDENLKNQISAGEVVERPLSVVKELVENSLDANCENIKIEIKDGGKTYISVEDDGEGIPLEDLKISINKYTTSKIKNLQDLYNVMTFGFRGEALASISSVSKISIISKIKEDVNAYKLDFDTISGKNISKTSANNGTKVIVKDLFFNTPARLNYLKTSRTEYSKILDYLYSISLSYPSTGFEFISEEKSIFKFNKNEDLKTRIYLIFGKEFFENILKIDFSLDGMNIYGYITNPKVNFSNKNRQRLFVNKRPISSPLVYKAINDAYTRFIPPKTNPGYVLNLKIDPTTVDVNVHPNKKEVRFANEQNIFRAFYSSLLHKLESFSFVKINETENVGNISSSEKFISDKNEKTTFKQPKYYTGSGTKFKSYSPYKDVQANPNQTKIKDSINFTKTILNNTNNFSFIEKEKLDLHYTKFGKIIGQIFNSYIVVESDKKMLILDQHALRERIIFENLKKNKYKKNSQTLLIPENIKLTPKEFGIIGDFENIFRDMGFDFEFLGNSILSIIAIPDFIKKEDLSVVFLGIIEDISLGNTIKSKNLEEIKNKIFSFSACRSAIKFGNKLNLFEINKLLNDSFGVYCSTCPHGRPSFYEIGINELKNKFER